jgi:hypothetical protein
VIVKIGFIFTGIIDLMKMEWKSGYLWCVDFEILQ